MKLLGLVLLGLTLVGCKTKEVEYSCMDRTHNQYSPNANGTFNPCCPPGMHDIALTEHGFICAKDEGVCLIEGRKAACPKETK